MMIEQPDLRHPYCRGRQQHLPMRRAHKYMFTTGGVMTLVVEASPYCATVRPAHVHSPIHAATQIWEQTELY